MVSKQELHQRQRVFARLLGAVEDMKYEEKIDP